MATQSEIARILLDMMYLPNSPLTGGNTNDVVKTYEPVLKDIPLQQLELAALAYKSTEKFFPVPSQLRQKAMEMEFEAMRIPAPAEAWGYVIAPEKHRAAVFCDDGAKLYNAISNKSTSEYWKSLAAWSEHEKACAICAPGKTYCDYHHPAVAKVVEMLGGRDTLLTDNPVADRARFIAAYEEIIMREKKSVSNPPEIKEYIGERGLALESARQDALNTGERKQIEAQIKRLAEGKTK